MGGGGGVQGVNKKYELIFLYFHILIFGLVEGGGGGGPRQKNQPYLYFPCLDLLGY